MEADVTKECERPSQGGSWVRDPKSGKLRPAGRGNGAEKPKETGK